MIGRARSVGTGLPAGAISGTDSVELREGWSLTGTVPGQFTDPGQLRDDLLWGEASVPGTVAASIGPAELDGHSAYHASDWWYRCTVNGRGATGPARLRFDGLATLAQVWFNGELVLESSNMFRGYEVDVTDLVRSENELVILFRSLDAALAERRPRPRWKTKLIDHQQLRWFRTTLLGRIPGWAPRIQPVGPWRGVWLEYLTVVDVTDLHLVTGVSNGTGEITTAGRLSAVDGALEIESGVVRVGDDEVELDLDRDDDGWTFSASGQVEGAALWWPRTHGEPSLHACSLHLSTSAGPVSIDCGNVGFRALRLDTCEGRIHFFVNGVRVFCRGSCWTSNDVVSLVGSPDDLKSTLELTAAGNANMVRVGGTMVYESDAFYRACDELGLMVWQDFMFANMDYPVEDESFAASIAAEAREQITRLQRHPSVVAYCGGSEVEQQAAMFGADKALWTNGYFSETLPELVEKHAPGAAYWPSTPTGGALPFHVGEGLTHYYGVGAYRRPIESVRLAGVRFTPECLGFSNVPEAANLGALTSGGAVHPHHPAWKSGVPRDSGAGWDFEDVRDHYLERLYGVDPVILRSDDPDRYLDLSRCVTGEVMERVFDEWRSEGDGCGGGLTWFLQDLRPGAGWGVIDSDRRPKAAHYHLKRAWAPRSVRLLDRGLDGLTAIVFNDRPERLEAEVEIFAITRGSVRVADARASVVVEGHGSARVPVEAAIGHFFDSTYSYRFGPPRHEIVVARLSSGEPDTVISEDVYRPVRSTMTAGSSLDVEVGVGSNGHLVAALSSESVLYDVRLDVRDLTPSDNHFCLTPGRVKSVELRGTLDSARPFKGYVDALNLEDPVRMPKPTTAD